MLQPHFADRLSKVMMLNNRVTVRPSFYIGLCISLFVLPIPWVFAWLFAVLVHEFGHLFALKLLQIPVARITLNFSGAMIETGYITPTAEIISALAGPIAGLGCLFVSNVAPQLAICAGVQRVYNFLPCPFSDGGRVVQGLLLQLFSDRAEMIYRWILSFVTCSLILLGLYLSFAVKLGMISFVFCVIPILKSGIIKIPCKQIKQIVQ